MSGTGGSGGVLPVGEDDLHAYVDGQLTPERRSAVERWLESNPEAAARAAFYARLNADLHRQYDHVLAEPIPLNAMTRIRLRVAGDTVTVSRDGTEIGTAELTEPDLASGRFFLGIFSERGAPAKGPYQVAFSDLRIWD